MAFRILLAAFLLFADTAAGRVSGTEWQSDTRRTPLVFSARSDLVVLNVIVKDARGAYVDGLAANAFTVLEDGQPQTIRIFAAEDTPVTAGLVLDGSASLGPSRPLVVAAAAAFVDAHNPGDEIFALTFTERVRAALDPGAPFTDDATTLRLALWRAMPPPGRTALYDAVAAGLAYLNQGAHQRRALVIIADGGDNASTMTFDRVRRQTQVSNAVIYTIAFRDPHDRDANPGRLRRLAEESGGDAFAPRNGEQIGEALSRIASALHHSYTLGYVPADTTADGRFRRLAVTVRTAGRAGLRVQTRKGYVIEER